MEASVSGPEAGRATGSALPRQVAVAPAAFWATPTPRRVAARTVAAPAEARSATASAGSTAVVVTPVGVNASPGCARCGNVAVTRTVTARSPDGNAQT
ncbi:hypothetical protein CD934_23105 [Streptomyces calvus]|uniref:Uncharacterized protein n=1 Tax=Streptomyces calvus TaxID=67282 RepID=A0A514JV33_9ACTN|nr:hypothetical protein CD934_23105 [Streptomyces calvus]